MPIESGPTGERKVRSLLLFLMMLAFSLWFAYDGWIGYPAENVKEHLEQLPTEYREAAKNPTIYKTVNEAKTAALRRKVNGHPNNLAAIRADMQQVFGGPPSFETKDTIYYFGPCYRVSVLVDAAKGSDRVVGRFAEKNATTILWQKGLAVVLALFSIYLLFFVRSVRRTKLVLDERGLTYRTANPISWDAMRSLDISRFSRKGFVDLEYDDQGDSRKVRLDEYHLEKFDDIVDELCARKGFENPLPVNEEPAPQS